MLTEDEIRERLRKDPETRVLMNEALDISSFRRRLFVIFYSLPYLVSLIAGAAKFWWVTAKDLWAGREDNGAA